MPADFAATMDARIRFVAKQANIPLVKTGNCKANLLVIFMPNGQAAMRNLLDHGPWLFGQITSSALNDLATDPALKDLAADPGPVHAWVNTEARGRYGESVKEALGRGDPPVLRTSVADSHIFRAARLDIVASVVVIDSAAVQGMPASQIADYVAMRGLAQTRPPVQPGTVGTILSLFDKSVVPPLELTRFDMAYLRAVYGSVPYIAGISKLARVPREFRSAANEK